MTAIDLSPPGATRTMDHGAGVSTLHYQDGSIRVRHHCKTIDGDEIWVAPALHLAGGHRVVQANPLTVDPSILCPDCGLHGWIQDGRWTT